MLAPLSPENQPALILKYAREAVALAGQRRYADLETDRIFQLALAHLIELTAEAAQKTQRNQAFWEQYPQCDDSRERLRAVRRQIAHFFEPMDNGEIWRTATELLPQVIRMMENILAETSRNRE